MSTSYRLGITPADVGSILRYRESRFYLIVEVTADSIWVRETSLDPSIDGRFPLPRGLLSNHWHRCHFTLFLQV